MKSLPMNPLQIEYFLSVARTKSVAKSSQELFVSAPAISKQLAALERDLHITLLNRSNIGMSLTPAGKEYYKFFAKTFAELNSLKHRYQSQQTPNFVISLGILEDWQIYRQLYEFEQRLKNVFPKISLVIYPLSPNELMEKLFNSKLDIVLCIANGINPNLGSENYIEETKLCTIKKILVYSDYLFNSPSTNIQIDDFDGQTLYSVSDYFKQMAVEENSLICDHYGLHPKLVSVNDLKSALAMVATGRGFTILDDWSIYRYIPELHHLPLNYYHHNISLFTHKGLNTPLQNTTTSILKDLF